METKPLIYIVGVTDMIYSQWEGFVKEELNDGSFLTISERIPLPSDGSFILGIPRHLLLFNVSLQVHIPGYDQVPGRGRASFAMA